MGKNFRDFSGKNNPAYRHGQAAKGKQSLLYTCWVSMIGRCSNPQNTDYRNYGGRGIKVCDRWLDFVNFRDDMAAGFAPGLTLERRNVNAGYSPENCTWIPMSEQAKNKRPYSEWKLPPMLRTNTSGIKGVSWDKKNSRWRASIGVNGTYKNLGRYADKAEAQNVYRAASAALGIMESAC